MNNPLTKTNAPTHNPTTRPTLLLSLGLGSTVVLALGLGITEELVAKLRVYSKSQEYMVCVANRSPVAAEKPKATHSDKFNPKSIRE